MRTLFAPALSLLVGCIPALPEPTIVAHSGQSPPVVVPFYPPPARVDVVPDAPRGLVAPVWIDGEWEWQGRRWIWQPGSWSEGAGGLEYAPPVVLRRSDGKLVWFRGELYSRKKAEVDPR